MCVFSVYIATMIAADRYEEMVGTVIKKNRRRTIGRGGFLRGIRVCCGKRWVFDCVADSSSIGGEECEDPRFVGKSYAFRRLSNVSSAVAKSLIAPVRVNRVLHRAITPIIPIISTRNSMQGRIITRLLKVAHPALRIPLDYRLTGLIDHRSTRVESTRAKSCSKLTFQEIPPRSAYDPPRSCAGSLQRSSFISRPVMLPLFNSI